MMTIKEAKEKCPNITLVNGENLSNYRKYSNLIFEVLQKFVEKVEKLGMDENYLDVTSIIDKRMEEIGNNSCDNLYFEGFVHPTEQSFENCNCGCLVRLKLGTHLAKEIREQIFNETGLTCCAGVAHNKLLAKLIGSQNKPNKQTVLSPKHAKQFMAELKNLRSITGIGEKTASAIEEIVGLKTIEDLQNCDIEKLVKKFGYDLAVKIKEQSIGKDTSVVKPSGKPKSIGLEDSCKTISIRSDVEQKFRLLLVRLVQQIRDDDRIPVSIKVTLRKYDPIKKNSHRETRQSNILPSLFKNVDGKVIIMEGGQEKLLKTIMSMFDRLVDLKVPFNITLLGLCFSKFQERKTGNSSIANFLMKKKDVEVQAITNLSNDSATFSSDSFRSTTASPLGMDYETMSNNSLASLSGSESEFEPSPKKKKLNLLLQRRRAFSTSTDDIASPTKLRVSELRLNSTETSFFASAAKSSTPLSMISKKLSPLSISNKTEEKQALNANCSGENSSAMEISPIAIKNPMKSFLASKFPAEKFSNSFFSTSTKTSENPILPEAAEKEKSPIPLIKSPTLTTTSVKRLQSECESETTFKPISEPPQQSSNSSESQEYSHIPPSVDLNVFKDLPIEMQRELLVAWKNNPANSTASSSAVITGANNSKKAKIMNGKNTLHKYFVKN